MFRLPTEAEWEFACRAGTTTRYSFGDDEGQLGEYAWYGVNVWNAGLESPQLVGQKLPNPWGFHDMHGNVWEYCLDWESFYSEVDSRAPLGGYRDVSTGGAEPASPPRRE